MKQTKSEDEKVTQSQIARKKEMGVWKSTSHHKIYTIWSQKKEVNNLLAVDIPFWDSHSLSKHHHK